MIDRVEFEEKEHERLVLDFSDKYPHEFELYYKQNKDLRPDVVVEMFAMERDNEDKYWYFVEEEYIDHKADLVDYYHDRLRDY